MADLWGDTIERAMAAAEEAAPFLVLRNKLRKALVVADDGYAHSDTSTRVELANVEIVTLISLLQGAARNELK